MGPGIAMGGMSPTEIDRISQERDLYLRLLRLGMQTELEPFLKEALTLVVELTGARQGYLELSDKSDEAGQSVWWMAHGCSETEVEDIRSNISRGIIAEALASGETIATESALFDERFRERKSVKLRKIQAVLCAPIRTGVALGVVYLQERRSQGPFSDQDRHDAEIFAQHLAPLADRLLVRRRLNQAADPTRELRERYRLESIVGRSPALARAMREAMLAAPVDVNVLLTGESGTGKSLLARAIHANSPRADGPFVEINCGALPTTLIESELFGARAGSHSEARRDASGKVAAAEGGTLFLDEVAEIPFESQPKLLQLLQSRHYYPLGATQPVQADVRLIAATNTDLEERVRGGRFREDLFFRLQVLPVRMPALRERREDLPELAQALCLKVQDRHRLGALDLSIGALRAIEGAEWAGNIRELENAVEAAAIRAAGAGARQIELRHVFVDEVGTGADEERALTFQEATRRFQRELLERTLADTEWNVTETARRLDVARSHVYNLIQAFGLSRR
jgi:Nif-specific regulatory protein